MVWVWVKSQNVVWVSDKSQNVVWVSDKQRVAESLRKLEVSSRRYMMYRLDLNNEAGRTALVQQSNTWRPRCRSGLFSAATYSALQLLYS